MVGSLCRRLEKERPDLCITDFEPLLPRAAARCKIPFISFDHQHFLSTVDLSSLPSTLRWKGELLAQFTKWFYRGQRQTIVSSFFTPAPPHNRHVVLRAKERIVARRHGAVLRSGGGMLPDEQMLSATCWMHGVFAAQLALGNTTFHKLLSVARDPYDITRASGLRILVEHGSGWRMLGVPSACEIGLSDCRWIYRLEDRTVSVHALASGDAPALHWRVAVEGQPCRFLVLAHLVLGERELDHAGRIRIDPARKRIECRPDPASLWGQRFPKAVYLIVTDTPDAIAAIGGTAGVARVTARSIPLHPSVSPSSAPLCARGHEHCRACREDGPRRHPCNGRCVQATPMWTQVSRHRVGSGVSA